MIVSNSHRFVFVHIQKTAGTSIATALDPLLRWNDVVLGGTDLGEQVNLPYKKRFGLNKHSPAGEIRAVVGEEVWASYFKFTFVRHPYSRIASLYAWLGQRIRKAPVDGVLWSWATTQAFVESGNFSDFIRHPKFLQSMAARPQADWVEDAEGRRIVDFVGRFEDLAGGIGVIESRIGVKLGPLGHHNPSEGGARAGTLFASTADYEHLCDLHGRDFEAFGYDPSLRFGAHP